MPGSMMSSTTRPGLSRLEQPRARSPSSASTVRKPVALEVADDDVTDDRLVVDDEDGGAHLHSVRHIPYTGVNSGACQAGAT